MKKLACILTLLIMTVIHLSAQNEITSDSIRTSSTANNIKSFGEFMLDMNLLLASPTPRIPSFSTNLLEPDATKNYNQLFQLPSQMILSKTHIYSSNPFGVGIFSTSNFLQSATFKVNETMRLSTYGQYTLDGKRVANPSALPWEKNNFMGGMELKFNKNFGIRIEVQQGRNPMFPY